MVYTLYYSTRRNSYKNLSENTSKISLWIQVYKTKSMLLSWLFNTGTDVYRKEGMY